MEQCIQFKSDSLKYRVSEPPIRNAYLQDKRFKKLIVEFEGLLDQFLDELQKEIGDEDTLDMFVRKLKEHGLMN